VGNPATASNAPGLLTQIVESTAPISPAPSTIASQGGNGWRRGTRAAGRWPVTNGSSPSPMRARPNRIRPAKVVFDM
jgi:hypothetical protein